MALPSIYDVTLADDATAAEQAQALIRALRGQRAGGQLGLASGDKALGALGQSMVQQANQQEEQLGGAAGTRLQRAIQRAQMAQQQGQHQDDLSLRRAQLGQQAAQNAAELALRRQSLDQEAWAATPDASGGIVMYNRKTGETRTQAPLGPGTGGYPGKPKDMWNEVQQLGALVEPILKARPDIDQLRSATERGNVAGFGPVQGRVPNLLTSAEGAANRQAAGRLMAAIIQATSGQAASEKEVERLLEANGMGRTAPDDQIKLGVDKLATQYDALLKQREARFHPAVVDALQQRGGLTPAGQVQPAPAPGAPPSASGAEPAPAGPRKVVQGKTYEKGPDGRWYEVD